MALRYDRSESRQFGPVLLVLAVCLLPGVSGQAQKERPRTRVDNADALSAEDKSTLAELALQWAAQGGIHDVSLLPDGEPLVVADVYLPANANLSIADRTLQVLSLGAIQTRANDSGDFLYFRFGRFRPTKSGVSVSLSLVWAVGTDSTAQYMSGGGATLLFERQEDTWTMRADDPWMS